ncbi:hypothetical protein WJX81_003668 [Elliptochloris bilobata]|uniref:Uncharacterized protein n=1 Tax=Elliptochloris bilobata TaxID=381761 RepID=A0AAW1QKK8_9CHLO
MPVKTWHGRIAPRLTSLNVMHCYQVNDEVFKCDPACLRAILPRSPRSQQLCELTIDEPPKFDNISDFDEFPPDPDPYNMDGGYWTLAGLQALAGVGLTGYLPLDPLSQPRHQAPYL